jgi:hypothetical protein
MEFHLLYQVISRVRIGKQAAGMVKGGWFAQALAADQIMPAVRR